MKQKITKRKPKGYTKEQTQNCPTCHETLMECVCQPLARMEEENSENTPRALRQARPSFREQ
jgi:hypothetical protein